MRRRLIEILRHADLREDEITIYLLALKLRQASIPELIEKSGLRTVTTYRVVKRLAERKLLEEMPINDKQSLYRPLSLQALIRRIGAEERRLRKLELALKGLDRLLPFIDLDAEEPEDDLIDVREGIDAFREEYLKFPDECEREYLHIGNMQNYWKTADMTYECPEERAFINKRLRRDIHCRILNVYTPDTEEFYRNDHREKRITKFRDDLPIMENYLGMTERYACHFLCDVENPRVIVLKQPDILRMYKDQFASLWQTAS